jgi:hypothetical protein
MATCKRCGAQIEYRMTAAGRWMPVDPGCVAVVTKRGTVLHGHVSHFCTCPANRAGIPRETRISQRRFVPI